MPGARFTENEPLRLYWLLLYPTVLEYRNAAIDEKYADADEFDLVDELSRISGTEIPKAIEEIRNADIRHTTECDACDMKAAVKDILGV